MCLSFSLLAVQIQLQENPAIGPALLDNPFLGYQRQHFCHCFEIEPLLGDIRSLPILCVYLIELGDVSEGLIDPLGGIAP